jgi:glc operon protein GlcG
MTKLAGLAALGAVFVSFAGGAQQTATPAAAGGNPLDVVPEKMPFDVPYGAPIALERATIAINAAVAEAKKRDWKLNVAVTDSGGNLVAFQRMDGAQLASIQISEHKARAAVTFRRETKAWESAIQTNGLNYVMTLDGLIASRGGIPLIEGGRIIGGIGCSGGTGSQDEAACKAGVAALQK